MQCDDAMLGSSIRKSPNLTLLDAKSPWVHTITIRKHGIPGNEVAPSTVVYVCCTTNVTF
jgi:hypothetical protein